MAKTIEELTLGYFQNHPNEKLPHKPVIDWVNEQYLAEHGVTPSDPWRAIRKLYEKGLLIKVRRGVYKYDPDLAHEVAQQDFSQKTRNQTLKRDGYKCVACGRGREDGVTLTVDHIVPKDKGGTNTLENAQTLCSQHNLMKKNYSQTEAGKRYFIRMYETAVATQDEKMIGFCRAIFDIYDEHEVDLHISRPDGD